MTSETTDANPPRVPRMSFGEAVEDQTIKDQEVARQAAVAFDLVRGDAPPASRQPS